MAAESADEAARDAAPGAAPIQRDLVAIGASAGGVEALKELVADLPAELPASVLVVMHVLATGRSMLPKILERAGPLPASSARHGDQLTRGHIYVAPPDHHLLVFPGRVHLSHGPRENGHRPALDPLFRSVARGYGPRAIGIILSGTLDDGAAGLGMIRSRGGATLAQDPDEALYPGMPRSAIESGAVERVAKISEMAELVCELIDVPVPSGAAGNGSVEAPAPPQAQGLETAGRVDPREGELSGLTCPECGGAIWEHQDGDVVRFMCHVGHAYSLESMQTEQGRALEAALWIALRSLEEREDLFRRMARRGIGSPDTMARFEARAADVGAHAGAIRRTIAELGRGPAPEPEEPDQAA
jgi:two-component system, chemotaxis family, protein-glutamate methylesterase/glutaminase